MADTDRAAVLSVVLDVLTAAGVPVQGVDQETDRPMLELWVPRRRAAAAVRAMDAVHWRWRAGGDDLFRLRPQRCYVLDSGVVVRLRWSRPARPGSLRRRLLSRVRPRRLRQFLAGDPWGAAVVRCRFAGLELLAGPGTFLSRAASEQLVTAALTRLGDEPEPIVADVGTGCGAAALALAQRRPGARVIGAEIDPGALRWARRNADRLGSATEFVEGSLAEPLPMEVRGQVSVLLANVPCVREADFEAAFDASSLAYVGVGADGLGLQRLLADQARTVLRPGGWLLLQLAPDQWPLLAPYLKELGYQPEGAAGDDIAVVGAARWPTAPTSRSARGRAGAPGSGSLKPLPQRGGPG